MADRTADRSMTPPLVAVAVGAAVALALGVLGWDTVLDMKVVLTAGVGVLALIQLVGALWMYGKLGGRAPSWVGPVHRASGTLAFLLAVFVGYHCLWALGLEYGTIHTGEPVPVRAVVHGVLGCVVFGAFVVKVVAVRSHRSPGWFLPLAGGVLLTLFLVVVGTSTIWYVGAEGWPSR
jgi:hypothetical protein